MVFILGVNKGIWCLQKNWLESMT